MSLATAIPPHIAAKIRLASHAISWNIPRGDRVETWLDEVSAAGFEGIAIFGMQVQDWLDDYETFARLLAQRGLELAAVTCFLGDSAEEAERVMQFMARAGAVHLAFTDFFTDLTPQEAADILNERGRTAQQYGVRVYYHNHTGGVGETREQLEQVMARVDRDVVHFMLDVGHATKDFDDSAPERRAGDFLTDHWGQIEFMEFKDWNEVTDLNTPLGEGHADYDRIAGLLAGGQYSGWLVVEQNGNDGLSRGRGALECAQISRAFLRRYGL